MLGPGHMGMKPHVLRFDAPSEPGGLPRSAGDPECLFDLDLQWHAHMGGWSGDSKKLVFIAVLKRSVKRAKVHDSNECREFECLRPLHFPQGFTRGGFGRVRAPWLRSMTKTSSSPSSRNFAQCLPQPEPLQAALFPYCRPGFVDR